MYAFSMFSCQNETCTVVAKFRINESELKEIEGGDASELAD
jgi:hypothetical protein